MLALLRVELCGKEVLFPDARNERPPIVSKGRDPLCLLWNDIIGVDEVEEVTTHYPLKHGNLSLYFDRIPTHMRNLMLWIGFEFHHPPFDLVQPFMGTKFLAF